MTDSLIKNNEDYQDALNELEALMQSNPPAGSADANRMEILALIIGEYEDRLLAIPLPDPIEAIKFRMEQLGLGQRDLIPYIGGRNRVSEILSGKRALTLTMIRALTERLGIPASVLVQPSASHQPCVEENQWDLYPVKEMIGRGWIRFSGRKWQAHAGQLMADFYAPVGGQSKITALFNRTRSVRSAKTMDPYALQAWCVRVIARACENEIPEKFSKHSLGLEFLSDLAKLSAKENGPIHARDALANVGVHLIVERHLSKTHVDAAALYTPNGQPVVAMSIRHDRLDNFWHCLFHELIHLARHLSPGEGLYIDDLDVESDANPNEREADEVSTEALVPSKVFRSSRAYQLRTPGAVQDLAASLGVHPAIVAGRVRHEAGNYRILNQLIGLGEVRRLFPDSGW